jgi:hypothetical protein
VVVSVNPYKVCSSLIQCSKRDQTIPELYSAKKIEEYKGRQMYEVPPHMYVVVIIMEDLI